MTKHFRILGIGLAALLCLTSCSATPGSNPSPATGGGTAAPKTGPARSPLPTPPLVNKSFTAEQVAKAMTEIKLHPLDAAASATRLKAEIAAFPKGSGFSAPECGTSMSAYPANPALAFPAVLNEDGKDGQISVIALIAPDPAAAQAGLGVLTGWRNACIGSNFEMGGVATEFLGEAQEAFYGSSMIESQVCLKPKTGGAQQCFLAVDFSYGNLLVQVQKVGDRSGTTANNHQIEIASQLMSAIKFPKK